MILENVEMNEIRLTVNLHCDTKKGNPGVLANSLRGEDRNQEFRETKEAIICGVEYWRLEFLELTKRIIPRTYLSSCLPDWTVLNT